MKRFLHISAFLCFVLANNAWARGEFRWESAAEMNQARAGHAAVAFGGKIYVFGGRERAGMQNQFILSTAEVFNPDSNRWDPIAPLPRPLKNMGIAATDSLIYLFGGISGRMMPVDITIIYNPASNTYIQGPRIPTPVFGQAAWTLERSIILIGGATSMQEYMTQSLVFDISRNRWSDPVPGLINPRFHFGLALSRTLWVIGGYARGGPVVGVEGWFEDQWQVRNRMPEPRGELGVAVLGDTVIIAGGITARDSLSRRVDGFRPEAEDHWIRGLPPMLLERSDFPLIRLGNALFALGGLTIMRREEHCVTASVEFYAWHEKGDAPEEEPAPYSSALSYAWPNPGNGWITFYLPRNSQRIIIFNPLGEKVASSFTNPRVSFWSWFAGDQPAGTYFYQIQTPQGIPSGGSVVILK